MPAKIFNFAKKANKQLKKLPFKVHGKVMIALDELQQNPLAGAKLGGELEGNYKYRVGDYRILYKFSPKESKLEILKIEHRQGVYK